MGTIVPNCLDIVAASRADYKALASYHYLAEPLGPIDHVFKVIGTPPHTKDFPDPIGIIVYSMPMAELRPRNRATNNFFKGSKTSIGNLRILNQKVRYISRFIVDPRFQKLGIGTELLEETLRRQSVPIVETQTPIDFTNKIFQKAGFHLSHTAAPPVYERFVTALEAVGLTEQSLACAPAVHARISALTGPPREKIEKEIQAFLNPFPRRKGTPHSLSRTTFFCSKLPYPQAYLIWHNPRVPRYDEQPG